MSSAATPSHSGEEPPEVVQNNPVLETHVWGKMHRQNDNWMASCCGETGSGKSWGALRIAEAVDPGFSVDQVAFSVREFMELVNDDSLGRGTVIVFEEASVEASAYEWWKLSNRILSQVLDTWRNQNRGAIFTHPAFEQLVKPARGRMSALIQMHRKYEDAGYTVAKYKYCQQDSDTGKIYKKYPIIDGKKFKHLKLNKPSKDLREAYEKRKANYTDNLNQELLEELIAEEEAEEETEADPREIAETILDDGLVESYISENNGQRYVDRDLIELDYDIGEKQSRKVKKLLMRHLDDDVM